MANPFITRAQSVVNWFRRDRNTNNYYRSGASSLYDSLNRHNRSTQSVMSAVWNRIAIDVANVPIKHIRVDADGHYIEDMDSHLQKVLTVSTNIDQTPQAFLIDLVISMFDEGSIAVIPETTVNPYIEDNWDVVSLRVAKIVQYHPKTIDVEIYDESIGETVEWNVPKAFVAIIENPLFYVLNKPNATLKRLIEAISLLDKSNEDSVNGKIDLIIHVPYTIRSESRQKIAAARRKDIEDQLANSKYGIAYMDPTETVTQLNRPANNTLVEQVESLKNQAFTQIGITEDILNGTADEKTMTNYRNRIVGMILRSIVQEFNRKYISQGARSNGQRIVYQFDPFEFSTVEEIAKITETFRRSEIATSNEMRSILNLKPSKAEEADDIRNPNLNKVAGEQEQEPVPIDEEQ